MHYLYEIFIRLLDICKQLADNLVNGPVIFQDVE